MILPAVLVLVILSVPLLGGDLRRTADLRLRGIPLALLALGGQIMIINVFHERLPLAMAAGLHLTTYAPAALAVYLNRRLPGFVLIGVGGGMNLAAIAANGGVMPAAPAALRAAGMTTAEAGFINSTAVAEPKLALLGDIFAVPAAWPLANVFSIGDVLLVIGAAVLLHRACRSTRRLPMPRATREVLALRPFRLLFLSQAISGLGDWSYAVVVAIAIGGGSGTMVRSLAVVLGAQAAAGMLGGLLGASVLDRWPRRVVLLVADGARALAVISLVVVAGTPSTPHFFAVAVVIGLGGSVHAPVLLASLPNLVPKARLIDANALVNLSFQLAVIGGPVLGGVLLSAMGLKVAIGFNALSFAISLVLVARIALPAASPAAEGEVLRSVREGLRHLGAARVTRILMAVSGLAVFAGALRAPAQPDFVLSVLGGTATTLGLVAAAWGAGMVIGTAAAPALTRHLSDRTVLAASVGTVGMAIAATGLQRSVLPVVVLALLGGGGNAIAVVIYETLLQVSTPDHVRGRVLAAGEALDGLGFVLGAATVALVGATLGPRGVYLVSGGLFLALAIVVGRSLTARDASVAPTPTADPMAG